jgi:hypothetical protein
VNVASKQVLLLFSIRHSLNPNNGVYSKIDSGGLDPRVPIFDS